MNKELTFGRLLAAVFLLQMALSTQRTVFSNFVVDDLGITADQLGWVEAVREIPGLLTIVLVMSMVLLAPTVLAGISTLFVSAGLLLYAATTNMPSLLLATTVYSIGFHLFFPLQSAMCLSLSQPHERGKRLGQVAGTIAAGTVFAALIVRVFADILTYRQILTYAAVFSVLACAVFWGTSVRGVRKLSRGIVYRAAYMPYYALRFLAGARRQIFVTFAAFALVSLYDTSLAAMSTLYLVCNGINILLKPRLGQVVDVWGERKALTFNYVLVTVTFLGYALWQNQYALFALFVVDSSLSGFDVALNTLLAKLAPSDDIAPSLAMGSTLEHVTGFLAPVLGGYLWVRFAPQATFLAGATLCVISLIMALRLRTDAPVVAPYVTG